MKLSACGMFTIYCLCTCKMLMLRLKNPTGIVNMFFCTFSLKKVIVIIKMKQSKYYNITRIIIVHVNKYLITFRVKYVSQLYLNLHLRLMNTLNMHACIYNDLNLTFCLDADKDASNLANRDDCELHSTDSK